MSTANLTQRILSSTIRGLQLRALKRIQIQFDPFHPAATAIRDFTYVTNIERVRLTNPACSVRCSVVCDRSRPQIDLTLINGKKYRLYTENFTSLELVQQLDAICKEHDPTPEEGAP